MHTFVAAPLFYLGYPAESILPSSGVSPSPDSMRQHPEGVRNFTSLCHCKTMCQAKAEIARET